MYFLFIFFGLISHHILSFVNQKFCNIFHSYEITFLFHLFKRLQFFLQKQNDIHSFKSDRYIRYKLTALKLIAYNGKMPTNNMIKPKSSKYSYFWICNVDAQIID